jgi:hypothetical protein
MNNYEIGWQYCLPVWMGHTFPNSVKRGVVEITAKSKKQAVSTFQELEWFAPDNHGYYQVTFVNVVE